jgi:heme A synthase
MGTFFRSRQNFTRYAWFVLGFLILVILWGAVVRATGSGAGCGSHWPRCNGVVIPLDAEIETIIEFTHRVTSAFSGVLVLGMMVWAFRLFPKHHIVRKGAVLSTFFIITEGLVGAGLVLLELVGDNASLSRAIAMALHLVNTFFLLAVVALTAWWAGGGAPLRLRGQGKVGWLVAIGLILMLILGASGAVTALGDTLFPAGSLIEGISQDFLPTAHFLIRLRVYHPIIGIVTGIYLFLAGTALERERPGVQTLILSRAVKFIVVTQLIAGFVNLLLLAPVWMQIIHLLLADLLWIAVILLGAVALSQEADLPQPVKLASQAGD